MREYKTKTTLVCDSTKYIDRGCEYYCSIKSLTFTPKSLERTFIPDVNKGDIWWWKLFGKIPVIPFKAKENLYKFSNPLLNIGFSRYGTKEEVFQQEYGSLKGPVLDGNLVYIMPSVEIMAESTLTRHKYDWDFKYFKTDEEAIKYFEHIEKMCKKYGNSLKKEQEN